MTCGSKNFICGVICPTFQEEYIGDTRTGNSKLGDRVRIYRQHIWQPEHKKRTVKSHPGTQGKGTSQYFRFYNLVQIVKIFSGNMKITLKKNVKKIKVLADLRTAQTYERNYQIGDVRNIVS